MKTTKYNGITYQLDESKFKPAYIKFDQDMFDDEIFPVLVGLGFEVELTSWSSSINILTNNYNGIDFHFRLTLQEKNRLQCHTATEFLNASGIFAVADELPKDWYIEVTEENLEELDAWRKSVASYYKYAELKSGWFVLSKHYSDESYVWAFNGIGREKYLLELHPNHQKIDLETFRKITGSTPKSVNEIPVTAEIVKSITIPYTVIDQNQNDAKLGALVRQIRMS